MMSGCAALTFRIDAREVLGGAGEDLGADGLEAGLLGVLDVRLVHRLGHQIVLHDPEDRLRLRIHLASMSK